LTFLPAWQICLHPGTDVVILKIFSPKNCRKNWRFYSKTASLCKKWIKTLVFKKNANFFTENWGKSLKIVIITLTLDPTLRGKYFPLFQNVWIKI
jgi:hypothetical protein